MAATTDEHPVEAVFEAERSGGWAVIGKYSMSVEGPGRGLDGSAPEVSE